MWENGEGGSGRIFKAATFLLSADMTRFDHLIAELKLDMHKGHDNYLLQ